MTASLYQSGSSALRRRGRSPELLGRLRCGSPAYTEDVRRQRVRGRARRSCAPPLPQVARRRRAGRAPGRPRRRRRRAPPASRSTQPRLRVVRVEVHDHEHAGCRPRCLRVGDQLVVVDRRGSAGSSRDCSAGFSRRIAIQPRDERRAGCRRARRSQCASRTSRESRYSSLPGSRGACSSSSNAGP